MVLACFVPSFVPSFVRSCWLFSACFFYGAKLFCTPKLFKNNWPEAFKGVSPPFLRPLVHAGESSLMPLDFGRHGCGS
jgi:hypothetical protein